MKMKRKNIFKKKLNIFTKKEIFVILFSIFSFIACLNLTSHIIYKNRQIEDVNLHAIYSRHLPDDREVNFAIQVIKPVEEISEPLPAVILIHGDNVGPEAMNIVIKELIDNGYLVAVTDFKDFEIIPTISKLEAVLDHLLQREDVNSEQIGVFGHSRGGYFSLILGMVRENDIKAVISGNFADWRLFSSLFPYLFYSIDYEYVFNSSVPHNVLFTLDENDERAGNDEIRYLNNLTNGQFNQTDILYGNFASGTAREVYYSSTIFSHISSLYSSFTIYKEISWLNQALGYNSPSLVNNSLEIKKFIQSVFFLIIIECILAFQILKNIIYLLSYQDLIIKTAKSYFIKKITSWKKLLSKTLYFEDELTQPIVKKQKIVNNSAQRDYQERVWIFYTTIQKEDEKLIPVSKTDEELFQENILILKNLDNKKFWKICLSYLSVIWISALIFKTGFAFALQANLSEKEFIFVFIDYFSKPTLLIFDDFFRFNFVELCLIVVYIVTYSILRKQPELKKLGNYSPFHSLKGTIISFEIYLIFTLFLSIIFFDITGDLAPSVDLRNFFIFLPLFYLVNLFVFEFFYNRISGTKNVKLKIIGIQFAIYLPFLIPDIFLHQVVPEFYISLFVVLILNPNIYKYFKNFKMVALFDYLFMIAIFAHLHF